METIITELIDKITSVMGNMGFISGFLLIMLESMIPILPLAVFIALNIMTFGSLFGFLISIYVLIDKDRFLTFSKKLTFIILGKRFGREAIYFVKTVHYMIGSYIGIKAIDSAIIAGMAFVGLSLLGSHYVLLITAIVGVANMIPYFGPFIGMVSGALINLFFDPIQAIIIFLYILALQQFDGWFLEPKLIGNRLGLRPFLVILGVIVGGSLYGPIGMLLGSPIMAVIKIYTIRFLNKFKYKYEDEV